MLTIKKKKRVRKTAPVFVTQKLPQLKPKFDDEETERLKSVTPARVGLGYELKQSKKNRLR